MLKHLLHTFLALLCATTTYAQTYNTETYTVVYDTRTSTGTISFNDIENKETLTITWNESDIRNTYIEVSIYPGKIDIDDGCEHTAQLHPATQIPVLEFSSLSKQRDILSARYRNSHIQLSNIARWCKYQYTDNAVFLYIDNIRVTTIPIKNIWYVGDMILEYLNTFKGGN